MCVLSYESHLNLFKVFPSELEKPDRSLREEREKGVKTVIAAEKNDMKEILFR